ncbi:HNH endonuclease [Candidatus Methylacidiphilum fumarolicum]|nr:HNH endonuclease [Candidatus Methylacidiphilum fumarolicum]TFE71974.1 HNH endonuclease [Candidatus Methylacidiphilum fumarolicum]TFE73860.1 HNH endonuclease [Candidatus Methylacidiphilum fumarolicum]
MLQQSSRDILNSSVLILNRLWQAVNWCTARRAFNLLYCGHAYVVHKNKDDFYTLDFFEWKEHSQAYHGSDVVHTVSFKIRVPKVILLLLFEKVPRKEVKFTRHNVFERDGYLCQYCGGKFDPSYLNLDHVIPRERGGKTTWENVVCSCIRCNSKKGNRTPQEAGMKLLKKPKKPKWRPLFIAGKFPIDESWEKFLDINSWEVNITE